MRAHAKAGQLLERFLDAEQLQSYADTRRFTVVDRKRRRAYLIGDDLQVRVYDLDSHRLAPPLETWCVYLPGTPGPDTILAQLLRLRDNPSKLRRFACVTSRASIRAQDRHRIYQRLQRAGYQMRSETPF